MDKYYCSNCMLLNERKTTCSQCGSNELVLIKISIQNQETKHHIDE